MAPNKPEIKLRTRSGGIYCGKQGNDYQLYVTMYILLRAFNTYSSGRQNFELRMECPLREANAGEFDDIWLKVDHEQLFVQVKHYTSRGCLTRGMLLPRVAKEKGPFSLYKFCSSVEVCRKKKSRNQKYSYLLLTNLPLSERTIDLFEEGDSKSLMMNVMKIGRFFRLRNTAEMRNDLGASKEFFEDFTLSAESLSIKDIKSRIKDEIERCTQEDPRIAFAELEQELTDWVCNKDTRNSVIDRKWVEHFFRKLGDQNEKVVTSVHHLEDEIENGQLPTLQIFTLRQILEKCRKFQFDTHHLLVDFDPQSGIKTKYRMLREVLKRAGFDTSSTIFTKCSQIICFPDRVDIIGRSSQIVAEQYCKLKDESEKMGLMVNTSESKYLLAGGTYPSRSIEFDKDKFEAVTEFVYHQSLITSDNNCSKEIERCINSGNQIFKSLQPSLRVYKEQILLQVLLGCETWTILKKDLQALAIFERQVLRSVFPNTRTNEKLAQLYGGPTIEKVVKSRRINWAGQMARLPDSDPLKLILFSDPSSCPKRSGGQCSSWLDQVERDLRDVNRGGGNWRYAARDEARWRGVVDEVRLKP